MSTELIRPDNLPTEVSTEIRMLTTSPAKYLESLPVEKIDAERPSGAITLSQYKRSLTREQQLMYISLMIAEVNDFFNVKGNMNAKQIKLTAELILDNDSFYDLTLGNIKACFRQKMMTEKLYDRLDGNIIIGWLREFKSELSDYCEAAKIRQERESVQEQNKDCAGPIAYNVYLEMLKHQASRGDDHAARTLADIKRRPRVISEEEKRRKELDFFKYKQEYLKSKRK